MLRPSAQNRAHRLPVALFRRIDCQFFQVMPDGRNRPLAVTVLWTLRGAGQGAQCKKNEINALD
jgi:hypothetical protein